VLDAGVVEGRKTFANMLKYIKMAASSNFGNVLSVLVASLLLPFLPMLPMHLLVQNLLYDFSQAAVPFDRVDDDLLAAAALEPGRPGPLHADLRADQLLFDLATFALMWWGYGAQSPAQQTLFQSGWFVESLLTQTLVVHLIRSPRLPFVGSRAAPALLATTGALAALALWLPQGPLAPWLKLQPCPPATSRCCRCCCWATWPACSGPSALGAPPRLAVTRSQTVTSSGLRLPRRRFAPRLSLKQRTADRGRNKDMDLIQALCRGPQQWRGLGRNHEDEEFTGRLELQPLVEERGVLLRYRALRLPDGRLVHEEATLLARDAEGQLCLWPVMSELPGIWCHRIVLPAGGTMRPPTRGAAGRSASPPARATTPRASARRSGWCWIRRANCTAHAWGLPGGDFAERSACAMRALPAFR
jgi:hypothetical protein